MPANRRNESGGFLGTYLVLAVLLLAFFCAAGTGFVWHRNRNEHLRRQLAGHGQVLENTRQQNRLLDRQLADLRTHRALERRAQELGLGLVLPRPDQILRIQDGAPLADPAPALTPPPVLRLAGAPQR